MDKLILVKPGLSVVKYLLVLPGRIIKSCGVFISHNTLVVQILMLIEGWKKRLSELLSCVSVFLRFREEREKGSVSSVRPVSVPCSEDRRDHVRKLDNLHITFCLLLQVLL